MHNLTFAERARIAYAAGNDELTDALEQLAEWEAEIERLENRVDDLERENAELEQERLCLIDQVDDLAQQLEAAE